MKILKPIIQVSFDEYLNTWIKLIEEFFLRIISNNKLFEENKIIDNETHKRMIEILSILLFLCKQSFKSKKNFTSEKNITELVEGIEKGIFYEIFTESNSFSEFKMYNEFNHDILEKICKNTYSKDQTLVKEEIIGLSLYILDNINIDSDEDEEIIQCLSVELMYANEKFLQLVKNSSEDTKMPFGKQKFTIVNEKG
ncbi:MAG: hypothetical protein Q4F88_01695 [Eubacteriales bacterium]|nr:hypothetical protein [Eubacteriales bacterium]